MLHKTVAEIREMSNAEYVGWNVYLGRKAQRAQMTMGREGR